MGEADAIELDGAGYAVESREILAPLTLCLAERRIGIVGRNGSGKSTLARLMAGLIAPTCGSVQVNGEDIYADRAAALREVGILFQNPDHQIIFPTCGEEVAFGLAQMGVSDPKGAARAALAEHGKAHWEGRPVGELSGGQRHLLCLIAVLAMAPKRLLLDEPFAGLDIPTVRALHREIARLKQQVVLITHDPAALAGFDRVIWLEAGGIRADGPAAQVLAEFTTAMEGEDAGTDLAG